MKRQNLPVILLALLSIMLIFAYISKDKLNDFISAKMQETTDTEIIISGQQWVDSLFNYTINKEDYAFTLIQFKSTGCTICRQMEPELKKLKNNGNKKINIVVMNVMNPNSINVMKYFRISAVPTHVILNKEGKETFRRYGYIPAEELYSHLN